MLNLLSSLPAALQPAIDHRKIVEIFSFGHPFVEHFWFSLA